MKDRRTSQDRQSMGAEDLGLFKKGVVTLQVQLLPEVRRNLRQDLLVAGKLGSGHEITVVFAGRRVKQAAPLARQLRHLRGQLRRRADAPPGTPTDLADTAVYAQIEGSWRPRFQHDTEGWGERSYDLIAARWRVLYNGSVGPFLGEAPLR